MITRHFSTNEKARLCLSTNKSKHRPSDQKFSKQRKESDRISHRLEALRHILKTFHEVYTIFLRGQRIGSHIGRVSWNIQHIWLISSFKQRDVWARFWSVFKVGEEVSIIFSIHRFLYEVLDIFPRLSYRLTFIMLNVGMVDNLEFCYTIFEFRGPKQVRFPFPCLSQSRVITFFRIGTSLLPFFFSRPKQLYWSYGYSRPTSRLTLPNLWGWNWRS